jgi:hypothetical protein
MAARVKAAGVKLMIQVQSVQQAIDAVSLGADAIVAQVCQPPLLDLFMRATIRSLCII